MDKFCIVFYLSLFLIHVFFSEAFPLLVVVAGGIGGLLLTVVVIVVLLACRRAVNPPADLSAWPRMQPDRLSTSTNTTSNQEDLDGSDSMPELYLKAQPDILNSNLLYGGTMNAVGGHGHYGNKAFTNDGYSGGSKGAYASKDNYAHYPPSSATSAHRYASDNNLVDVNKFTSNYSSPYLQSVSPVSDVFRSSSHHGHHWDQGYSSSGEAGGYGGGSGRASGRFNAVAHSLQSNDTDLNESSVGTHV